MDISVPDLLREYDRAVQQWPFIHDAEKWFGLPPHLGFAQGSRETNLTNEVGDGGHGHGVFQLDDRFHQIPAGFDADPYAQAQVWGGMMAERVHETGTVWGALVAYNSGNMNGDDWTTANHDYAADVLGRLQTLQQLRPTVYTVRMFAVTSPYMRGNDIRYFQGAMNAKRFQGTPVSVDGIYGPDTAVVVKDFQQSHGLTPDGIVGPLTLSAMSAIPVP